MKSDVWEKFPKQHLGKEGLIIDLVLEAYDLFGLAMRYPPSGASKEAWERFSELAREHPPVSSPEAAGNITAELFRILLDWRSVAIAHWKHLWGGDQTINFDQCADVVAQLGFFFYRLEAERQAVIKSLPPIKRYNKRSPHVFFTKVLSPRLESICGRPLDAVVDTLASVAFDLVAGVGKGAIRARRR
jgi:hypothetical protein